MLNFYELTENEQSIAMQIVSEVMRRNQLNISSIDIDITVIDADEMRELNNSTRGIDAPTDVLTFPNIDIAFPFDACAYADSVNPLTGAVILGEIIIAREIMNANAVEYGHSATRECAYLITHGMMHLLGYDHMIETDKAIMRLKEDEILDELGYTRDKE